MFTHKRKQSLLRKKKRLLRKKEKIVERKEIVEKKEKKEHEIGNFNHCGSLMKANLSRVNEKLEIRKNQIKSSKKLENKQKDCLKPTFCFYCGTYQESSVHYCT